MMKNILHDLYLGKIIPFERRNKKNDKLLDIVRKIGEEEQYFVSKLSPDDCLRFDELSNLYSVLSDLEELEVFSYSFTLGAFMMQEMLKEAEAMKL